MAAAHPMQFVTLRENAWVLFDPTLERTIPLIAEAHGPDFPHRHHFVESPPPAPAPPPAAPAPQIGYDKRADKLAGGDREHSRIAYNDRTAANKDINATAFENDSPWGRRPTRANVGFAAVKSKFRR